MRGSPTADYPHAWPRLQGRGGGSPEDWDGFALGAGRPGFRSPRVKDAAGTLPAHGSILL